MKSYEELLERAFEEIPKKKVVKKERFEIPKVRVQ
jgi:translation initiation factor 2 beta subunit (eIF-2beta)/eIF-5